MLYYTKVDMAFYMRIGASDIITGEMLGFIASSSSSNPCHPNPCQNDGTCEDIGSGNYKCECPGVYGGDNCEKGKTLKVLVFSCLPNIIVLLGTELGKVWCFCSQKHGKRISFALIVVQSNSVF